jgi:hypothetical protein
MVLVVFTFLLLKLALQINLRLFKDLHFIIDINVLVSVRLTSLLILNVSIRVVIQLRWTLKYHDIVVFELRAWALLSFGAKPTRKLFVPVSF